MKKAFTLAETLIILVLIGVVATLVIPNFVSNIREDIYIKQKRVFSVKFQECLKQMRTNGDLGKTYNSTADFVETLKNNCSITRVCQSNKLTDCFSSAVSSPITQNNYITTSTLNNAKDIEAVFSSDIVGIQFADGVVGLLAYNPNCIIDRIDISADVGECVVMVFDVNGKKGPNKLYKDVGRYGTRVIFSSEPFSIKECQEAKEQGAPINGCSVDNDRWASAVYRCYMEGGRLPTWAELQQLARELYGPDVDLDTAGLKYITIINQELWKQLCGDNSSCDLASSSTPLQNTYHARVFGKKNTYKYYKYKNNSSNTKAYCVK